MGSTRNILTRHTLYKHYSVQVLHCKSPTLGGNHILYTNHILCKSAQVINCTSHTQEGYNEHGPKHWSSGGLSYCKFSAIGNYKPLESSVGISSNKCCQ